MQVDGGESITVNLKSDNDRKSYAIVSISLALDTKNKDYKKGTEAITANEDLIKDEVIKVIAKHTIDDMHNLSNHVNNQRISSNSLSVGLIVIISSVRMASLIRGSKSIIDSYSKHFSNNGFMTGCWGTNIVQQSSYGKMLVS